MARIFVHAAKSKGSNAMKRIALTGGIGCGKSTVARIFQTYGIPVIDADAIVHALYNDKKVVEELAMTFGDEIKENGQINRKKLGAIIFHDDAKKHVLDKFFQNRVNHVVETTMNELERAKNKAVVYDAALIFEWQLEKQFDAIIVVDAPEELRIQRICERDQLTKEEAKVRINAQMPLEEKIKQADEVIINDQDIKKVQVQVQTIIEKFRLNL